MVSPFDVAWAILKNDTEKKILSDLWRHRRASSQEAAQREEASYANTSLRESPIHDLNPFGPTEPEGATFDPMENMMADDIYDPIFGQRQREQEPFNPFTVKPSSPRFIRPGSRPTPLTSKTTQRRMQ